MVVKMNRKYKLDVLSHQWIIQLIDNGFNDNFSKVYQMWNVTMNQC